jgi:hypothetical protein
MLRLTPAPPVPPREPTGQVQLPSYQDLVLAGVAEARPAQATGKNKQKHKSKHKSNNQKRSGKKLLAIVVVLAAAGGAAYKFRASEPVQKVLGHQPKAAALPVAPFVRPKVTSAEYSVTTSAVQNGTPNNVTTTVRADYALGSNEISIANQVGGAFTTSTEIRTPEFVFRPGADAATWAQEPRVPESLSPYEAAEFIPMINDVVDQPLRDATKAKSSKKETVGGATISTLTYVLDRAKVPEIAPAIFARVPWLFDVPNATTLTIVVSYDAQSGIVRHLSYAVDPPQPGTGSDATWVTSYTLDVTSVNAPVTITVPATAVDPAAVPPVDPAALPAATP